jgi:hypothetical protein
VDSKLEPPEMNSRQDGQAFLETLIWIGLITLFLIACGGTFRFQYDRYREVLQSAGGFTEPSFLRWQPHSD